MLEDDFLKERQNIRQKMLKFSRAMNQGKPLDEDLKEELSSDNILRRRFKKTNTHAFLEELDKEYESQNTQKSNIYLKKDLINVKLEERQSLAKKILSKMREKTKESPKKSKKIFPFGRKKLSDSKNIPLKTQNTLNSDANTKPTPTKKVPIKPLNQSSKTQKTPPIINTPKKPLMQNQVNIKQSLESLQKKITQEENKQTLLIQKNQNDEDSQKVKNVLLEGFYDATKEDRNLNFHHLLFVALLITFTLILFTPQIYIRNQIYYLSREIATLKTEQSVLNEENKDLQRRLENMRFQNQILDYLE